MTQALHPRDALKDLFLRHSGFEHTQRVFLAGDASFRKYDRVIDQDQRHYVLMDAPPEHEDTRPFTKIARFLVQHGLSAPRIIAEDAIQGFLLLEDFGDVSFTKLLAAQPKREKELYEAATNVLLQLRTTNLPAHVLPYSLEKLMEEALLLVDWFLAASRGKQLAAESRKDFIKLWEEVLQNMPMLPPVLTLRDFHADNLMWRENEKDIARVGLLDFQDALIGSPAYDLVSFLEDARRDISAETIEYCLQHYIQQSGFDKQALRAHFSILGAQRNSKIIGIFTRLTLRDHKPHYLAYLPRVWRWLEQDLTHPSLVDIRQWVDHYIPVDLRQLPSEADLRLRFDEGAAA